MFRTLDTSGLYTSVSPLQIFLDARPASVSPFIVLRPTTRARQTLRPHEHHHPRVAFVLGYLGLQHKVELLRLPFFFFRILVFWFTVNKKIVPRLQKRKRIYHGYALVRQGGCQKSSEYNIFAQHRCRSPSPNGPNTARDTRHKPSRLRLILDFD